MGATQATQRAEIAALSDEERDILRDWWDEETTVGVESSFPIISRIIDARIERIAARCQASAVEWFDEHGPLDRRGATLWDVAAWLRETSEGVGTGASGGGDPAKTEATLWDNRSADCPEAPAQAHLLALADKWEGHAATLCAGCDSCDGARRQTYLDNAAALRQLLTHGDDS